jgi:hypothetical protein
MWFEQNLQKVLFLLFSSEKFLINILEVIISSKFKARDDLDS